MTEQQPDQQPATGEQPELPNPQPASDVPAVAQGRPEAAEVVKQLTGGSANGADEPVSDHDQ